MKYELVDKEKKLERTIEWLRKFLDTQKEHENNLLEVIQNDGRNQLSLDRKPTIDEWKKVYTDMGWIYFEEEEMCYCKTPYKDDFFSLFSKSEKSKTPIHPSSHYGEVVLNYETYFLCKQDCYRTLLVLKEVEKNICYYDFLNFDTLKYDEALCILLGIDPHIPSVLTVSEESLLSVFDYEADFYDISVNGLLFRSEENQSLKRKFEHNEINTKDFLRWAVDKGFIKEIEESIDNQETTSEARNYPEWLAKELHKQLTEQCLISGDYASMWQWLPKYKNTLPYLADKLSAVFQEECPPTRKQPNLTAYIEYSGTEFRKVPLSTDRTITSKIDTVINNLKSNKPE